MADNDDQVEGMEDEEMDESDQNKRGGGHESHEKGVETTKKNHGDDFYKRIGQKGGKSQGKENNPGNFANRDPKEVEEIARKGGES